MYIIRTSFLNRFRSHVLFRNARDVLIRVICVDAISELAGVCLFEVRSWIMRYNMDRAAVLDIRKIPEYGMSFT